MSEKCWLQHVADQIRLPGIVCRLFLFMYNYCSTRIEGTAPPHTIDARRAQNAARETLWVHTTTTCTCIECTYVVRIRMVLACLNCLFSFFSYTIEEEEDAEYYLLEGAPLSFIHLFRRFFFSSPDRPTSHQRNTALFAISS